MIIIIKIMMVNDAHGSSNLKITNIVALMF